MKIRIKIQKRHVYILVALIVVFSSITLIRALSHGVYHDAATEIEGILRPSNIPNIPANKITTGTITGNLGINGNLDISGNGLVNGNKAIKILTFSQDINWHWFRAEGHGTYYCFVGGIAFPDGDIWEDDTSYIMQTNCKKGCGVGDIGSCSHYLDSNPQYWFCGGGFKTRSGSDHEDDPPEVRVHVVCVKNELVDSTDYSNIF